MKITKYVKGLCVGLATFGLVVPNLGVAIGAETPQAARPATASVIDVSLMEGSVLQGQVMSPQGQVVANAPVVLHHGQNEVAKTTTNSNGEFALRGVKGGVYVVSTDGAAGVVRAWTPRSAPPSSVKGVLLVPQDSTSRAQLGNGPILSNFGVGAIILGGVLATVLVVSIDHNNAS